MGACAHTRTHTLQGSPLTCRNIHMHTDTHTHTHMQKAQGVFVGLSETQLFRAETKAPRSRRWTISVHTERDKAGPLRQRGRFSNHCRASQLISSVVMVPPLRAPVTGSARSFLHLLAVGVWVTRICESQPHLRSSFRCSCWLAAASTCQ